jgi:hypothetical protein
MYSGLVINRYIHLNPVRISRLGGQQTKQLSTSTSTQRLRASLQKCSPQRAETRSSNIGVTYPNQTFTGWIPPASPVSKSAVLSDIEGKHVKITGRKLRELFHQLIE